MTTTVWTPYASASLNSAPITGVTRARVTSSMTDPVDKAYVQVYPSISWSEADALTATLGGGAHNLLRFTGNVYAGEDLNTGPDFELTAYGPLFKAQKFRNNNPSGLTLTDLTGGPAPDEDIARAVLTIAGVTFVSGNIGGTGIIRGTLASVPYTWRYGESALAYLGRLSKASLGYSMLAVAGVVYRVQLFGRPNSTSTYTLTEGIDIFDGARRQKESINRYTAIVVTGFDYGTGDGPVSFSDPDPTPAGVDPYPWQSNMIERALESDPGDGVSAEAVGAFIKPEVDRQILRVTLRTPRDDPFAVGQTHTVTAARLGLSNEKLRLVGVTSESDADWFTHTLEYIGGGTTSSGGYTGP